MKKFIIKILYFTPILLGIAFVNYSVDPVGYFHTGSEKQMAQEMLAGNNIVPLSILKDRLLQYYYIQGLPKPKNILIFGSSRAMLVDSDLFPGKSVFNSSVAGASVEDLVTLYSLYRKKNMLPETIILGVDPWLFNVNNALTSWLTLSDEYQSSFLKNDMDVLKKAKIFIKNTYQMTNRLLSPLYVRQSVYSVLARTKRGSFVTTTSRLSNQGKVIESDGSIMYEPKVRNRTSQDVLNESQLYINSGGIYSMDRYYALDPSLVGNFQKLIKEIKHDGIKIIFFLAPYHPIVYSFMVKNPDYRMLAKSEEYIRGYAEKNGITIIGSYDPKKLSLTNENFYDGMHVRQETIKKLFTTAQLSF